MSSPEHANYLLIDGALRPGALVERLKDDQSAQANPLYSGGRWSELRDQGPILIQLDADSRLVSQWLNEPRKQQDSTLLYSTKPLNVVANHLRQFICPPDAWGGNGLLRFSDPLVASFWLSSFSDSQLAERLGPIEHWWVGRPTHSWQEPSPRSWQRFSRVEAQSSWTPNVAFLDYPQLAALARAQRWQLEDRFYQWLNSRRPDSFAAMNNQQTSDWMQTTIDSGLAWGLFTERGLIIWAEISLDMGSDFADQRDGRYQTWLDRDPEHPGLSPELRIKAFDIFRHMHRDFIHAR
ncbi:DUF4123 domain-containing protein [Pseudomonas sp. 10B1]|uniref:DUF4123 domain-containing protein n=1 Tax=unclassified Pseudomonas TaxID=196821 RepID=UPI002AB5307F|nr:MULTISPECIES: DUF4123 domain-containing protein [unclassified Pseudomonas]MDY7562705.1 DUF4123 domain-containing protein [Pseudomonas sp. AB6]MEA9977506.1 DUF4123 domain-containing protein [Pseudomonas sp. RTS4]MEA9995907.1 DUF4123 domain-containing protein [Pseudomonas sp. AA4]MEB0087515.1 DUF4123 domain-containing protein [Pseudomonas sp. RTI1]MEB0127901.1 DUF4123 domain-containing protein [Pseudomonas sp. CCC1.2]